MFRIQVETAFLTDYKRVTAARPQIKRELEAALDELVEHGAVPEERSPHELANPSGNYNGHVDFHLSDGEVDVLVLHMPRKTNPNIRLVRMGGHDELFQGPLL